jgi:hypothetical protein
MLVSLYAAARGASNRNRTGTPLFRKAADFKSAVSTNFTIEAVPPRIVPQKTGRPGRQVLFQGYGIGGNGAGEESRTLDLNLGKVALYQLSYSRMECV